MDPVMIFSTAFLVGLSGAMMPGPVTVVLVGQAIKNGFRAAPLVTLGHGLLEGLMIALLVLGLGSLLESPVASGLIGVVGALFLAWMGSGMVKTGRAGKMSLRENLKEAPVSGAFWGGIAATLANPYWFVWWVTVGAGFVVVSRPYGFPGLFLFFCGHLLSDLVWLSFLALVVVSGKKYLSDRVYNGALVVLGVFLIGFAVYFLYYGFKYLAGGSGAIGL